MNHTTPNQNRQDAEELASISFARLHVRRCDRQHLPVGAKLPSHAALMREYNVSVTVVRMALDDLGSEGLIRSQQGRGTFVHATPESAEPRRSAAFLALQEQLIAIEKHLSQIDERLDALEQPRRREET